MKIYLLSILCLVLSAVTHAQTAPTVADWQSDLRFLQQTVHKDYPFLLKKITAAQFDAEADKLYNAMPTMQDHERALGIARLVARFKYGHTFFRWRASPAKFHMAPVNFYWFSDGIYVEATTKDHSDILGARLVKVEGMPVMQAAEAIKPLVAAENDQFFKSLGLDYLGNPEALHAQRVTKTLKKTITYTFEKDGKTFDKTINTKDFFLLPKEYGFIDPHPDWITARDTTQTPHYLKHLNKIYYYEYLPASKTLYVRQSQIQDDPQEAIPAFYKKVFEFIENNDVERLVLDVRLNGGGNNTKINPIITGIIASKKINQPGKLFVIIGRRTFSACQNLVNRLSTYTNALFVGEATAENVNFYGDNYQVNLPRIKTPVFLSFAWWQDKEPWDDSQWLAPQLAVDMSFRDYQTNKDPMLEACLRTAAQDIVLDPIATLGGLLLTGRMKELEATAQKMVADPRYRYIEFERKFNKAGYELMMMGQSLPSIAVLELNTKLYPGSATAWSTLAEAYRRAKQIDKAVESYNKVIAIDPTGDIGNNARQQIKEIKKG